MSLRRPRSPSPPATSPDGRRRKRQKRVRDIEDDLRTASAADYHVAHGLRFAVPYVHEFRMTCKLRWRGRRLLEVFNTELSKSGEPSYWSAEMGAGRIVHNGAVATAESSWAHDDLVLHAAHRHESPVAFAPCVRIVHEDENVVVVDKPSSVPVHPCGTYRRNSLQYLLAAQGHTDLRLAHRLDKATSGCVIFAKTRGAAADFSKSLADRALRKRYLALVGGRFFDGFTIDCAERLSVDKRLMKTFVDASGKEARTLFRAVAYDAASDQSLVIAEPTTGRSHQIRVHLKHLSHPIVDDSLYNASATGAAQSPRITVDSLADGATIAGDGKRLGCTTCPAVANVLSAGSGHEFSLSLHALIYESATWKYETALPRWAAAFPFPGGSAVIASRIANTVRLRDTPLSLAAKALASGPARVAETLGPPPPPHKAVASRCAIS